jgi:uncharacterized protein YgiB involved in biofilm formation
VADQGRPWSRRMNIRLSRAPSRSRVPLAVGGILALVCTAAAIGLLLRPSRPATVFITADDCRRSFDDAGCRAVVARAQSLHADTAPLFQAGAVCEFVYGPDMCTTLQEANIELNLYAPKIVAIAVTADAKTVMPLYLGPPRDRNAEPGHAGRPVYFRNRLIGYLSRPSFGGAELPVLTDVAGNPVTESDLRALAVR